MKKIKALSIIAGAVALTTLTACGNKLTKENYDKLEMGMDVAEVEAIIGTPSECEEALGAQSCTWGDDSKQIKVKSVAGKAVFFSNKGL